MQKQQIQTGTSASHIIHHIPDTEHIASRAQKVFTGMPYEKLPLFPQYIHKLNKPINREAFREQHIWLLEQLTPTSKRVKRSETPIDIIVPDYDTRIVVPNLIDRVGMEFEGGWYHIPDDYEIYGDGSVEFDTDDEGYYESEDGNRIRAYGESHTDPFHFDLAALSGVSSTMLRRTVEARYPDAWNHTCGLHTHISFPSIGMYSAFVCKEFQPWLLNGIKTFAEKADIYTYLLAQRINGEAYYCGGGYSPDNANDQIVGQGHRYTAVNYCWAAHRTMEIRVLPMFESAHDAYRMIREVLRLVSVWAQEIGPHSNASERTLFSTDVEI